MMLTLFSRIHAAAGPAQRAARWLDALGLRRVKRAWLSQVLDRERPRPDEITVLIGARNRGDHRLANALRSFREQTYPARLVQIIVVDYGSEAIQAATTRTLCRLYGAHYIRVSDIEVWSRSRCLNIGLRRARTKWVMTSDVDVMVSTTYLADAIAALTAEPLSVLCAPMLDLPAGSADAFRSLALNGRPLQLDAWRPQCTPRLGWPLHPSVAVTYARYLELVGGYDEFYEIWGSEDEDLLLRLRYLGLDVVTPTLRSFYVHQWHPKYEDVPGGERAPQIERNRAHLLRNHAIVRNRHDWGAAAAHSVVDESDTGSHSAASIERA